MPSTVVIVGAGVCGVTAALELRQRGYVVKLLDPGPLPHPLAASTDINKAIRLDYGPDEVYLTLMEDALARWREWQAGWQAEGRGPLFHETGLLFLCRAPLQPGGYEWESYQRLLKRGRNPTRLGAADIAQRFPAWAAGGYVDGYFNPDGGYAQSGAVIERLVDRALRAGVEVYAGQAFERFSESGQAVTGVVTRAGLHFEGDCVIIATGAWTPHLLIRHLPELAGVFRSNGMPVFHLKPARPELFRAEVFPVFTADVTATGYYGFPLHPVEGVVKIANHGPGREMHPESPERQVTAAETADLRAFLAERCPALAEASITYTRVCLYCDTWDGHFWIAPHPERPGLVVAAGDSGHGFKFAPVLGGLIADAVEGRANPYLDKFRWRPNVRPTRSDEATRYQVVGSGR